MDHLLPTTPLNATPRAPSYPSPLPHPPQWVARDVSGARLHNLPPYISHAPSQARLKAGLPIPAACCWNGLAALRAAPLLAGLRFRSQLVGECRASECSLLCDDLHRLGRSRIVIDPAVRVAYEWEQALQLAGRSSGGSDASGGVEGGGTGAEDEAAAAARAVGGLAPAAGWQAVAAAAGGAAVLQGGDWQLHLEHVECCDLAPGRTYVNFRRDCRPYDVMATNFTHSFLESRRQVHLGGKVHL